MKDYKFIHFKEELS